MFSKIIANRLTSCHNHFVSLEQGAFFLGKSIFDNITFTQKIVQSINRKSEGDYVIPIMDMGKAYDRVDWWFFLWVMESFGFSNKVFKLILECVETP